jgi:hypothetical protein
MEVPVQIVGRRTSATRTDWPTQLSFPTRGAAMTDETQLPEAEWDGGQTIDGQPVLGYEKRGSRLYVITPSGTYVGTKPILPQRAGPSMGRKKGQVTFKAKAGSRHAQRKITV